MKIENEVKLAFDDVMIIPKRSNLKSRSEVSLQRSFKFKHSTLRWEGIPIISANMDTIGTTKMAEALNQFDILTGLHKFYNESDMLEIFLGEPTDCYFNEIEDDLFEGREEGTDKLIGFKIFNFKKRGITKGVRINLPANIKIEGVL